MPSTDISVEKTPRYFWRRLLAYAIDVCTAWLVAAVLLGILADDDLDSNMAVGAVEYTFGFALHSDEFRPPLYIGSVTCGQATPILASLQAYVAPASIASTELCVERNYGLPVAVSATAILDETAAAGDLGGKTVDIPLRILSLHRFADTIAFGVFIFVAILATRLSGRTFGKRLMGLKVVGRTPVPSLRRELIRNLPHLLVVPTFALINWLLPPLPALPFGVQALTIGLQILSAAAFIFLWLVPMIRWRGALPHDCWLGTRVERVDANQTGGHGDIGGPGRSSLPSEGYAGLGPANPNGVKHSPRS